MPKEISSLTVLTLWGKKSQLLYYISLQKPTISCIGAFYMYLILVVRYFVLPPIHAGVS